MNCLINCESLIFAQVLTVDDETSNNSHFKACSVCDFKTAIAAYHITEMGRNCVDLESCSRQKIRVSKNLFNFGSVQ